MKTTSTEHHGKAMDFLKVLTSRIADKGTEVRENFKAELQKINPAFQKPSNFTQCPDWFYPPEGNGTPIVPIPQQDEWEGEADEDGLPKDAELSESMLNAAKIKAYARWIENINAGMYDPETSSSPSEDQEAAEDIDMAERARRDAEKAKREQEAITSEIVDEKIPDDEDEEEDDAEVEARAQEERASREESDAPLPKSLSPLEARFLDGFYDLIASCDGPKEDKEQTETPYDLVRLWNRMDDLTAEVEALRKQADEVESLRKFKEDVIANFPFLGGAK